MEQVPDNDARADDAPDVNSHWNRRSLLRGLGGAGLLGAAVAVRPSMGTFAQEESANSTADSDAGERPTATEDLVIPRAVRADLTNSDASTAGRIVHLIDDDRSVWLDTGDGWVSLGGGVFNVRAFGATGDGQTDDWAAFHQAIETMSSPLLDESTTPYGRTLLIPPGRYRLAQTLVINRAVHLVGAGRSGDSLLLPDLGIIGVVIKGADVITGGSDGRAAEGAMLEGVRIEAGAGGTSVAVDSAHGIWLQARATIRDCAVVGFGGNGVHIESISLAGDAASGTHQSVADGWAIDNSTVASNAGHGVFTTANAGVCVGLDASENGGWGIHDASTFGNTYLQCHADANAEGPFQTIGTTNQSNFIGCVSETDTLPSSFVRSTIVVSGQHGAGFAGGNVWNANGSRVYLLAQDPGPGEGGIETAPTLELQASERQQQPHLLVNDAGGERVAELDVAGRLSLGPLSPDRAAGGAADAANQLIHLSGGLDGQAGVRWVLADDQTDFVGWAAQARAFADQPGPDVPDAEIGFSQLRLTVQTPAEDGSELDTLTLRTGAVGIGTTAPAAALDIASTTSGFLPPRLTPEQRDSIAAPPEGSVIYNLSSKRLNTFDGGSWREEGGLPRLTTEQRDQIDSPSEGSFIYNLTSKRLNFHDGDNWQEVTVAETGG